MQVVVLNRQRTHRVRAELLLSFLERAAEAVGPRQPSSFAVSLVSPRRIRAFNRQFRGKDRPTDVLAFPAGRPVAPTPEKHLGDIVISVPQAAVQAREARHSLATELNLLALHGYLHLLGYDHESDAGEMLRLERRLRRRLLAPKRSKADS